MNPRLTRKAKAIESLTDEITKKLTLLDNLLNEAVDPKELVGISVPVKVEGMLNVYRLRIEKGEEGITGILHVPKKPGFRPEKVVIVGKAGS